jgi:hypothetical protein
MISAETVREIIAIYAKHGWVLRRVLLSAGLKRECASAAGELFGDVAVIDSDIDAAWFSRPPAAGGIPWEIRHLNSAPYALLENIDEFGPEFEDSLASVETRLRSAVAGKKSA